MQLQPSSTCHNLVNETLRSAIVAFASGDGVHGYAIKCCEHCLHVRFAGGACRGTGASRRSSSIAARNKNFSAFCIYQAFLIAL